MKKPFFRGFTLRIEVDTNIALIFFILWVCVAESIKILVRVEFQRQQILNQQIRNFVTIKVDSYFFFLFFRKVVTIFETIKNVLNVICGSKKLLVLVVRRIRQAMETRKTFGIMVVSSFFAVFCINVESGFKIVKEVVNFTNNSLVTDATFFDSVHVIFLLSV